MNAPTRAAQAAPPEDGRFTAAGAARPSERDNAMTQIDCLVEVAKNLKEARILAERCSDRALLYFIDMTLAHVCDSLDSRPETKGAAEDEASPSYAAA
jgi:hypothetical protein